jgi:hypothetical protein
MVLTGFRTLRDLTFEENAPESAEVLMTNDQWTALIPMLAMSWSAIRCSLIINESLE